MVFLLMAWYTLEGQKHSKIKISPVYHCMPRIQIWTSTSGKNNETGRWWMEVPSQPDHWVSCTYDDYLKPPMVNFLQD